MHFRSIAASLICKKIHFHVQAEEIGVDLEFINQPLSVRAVILLVSAGQTHTTKPHLLPLIQLVPAKLATD